MRPSTVDSIVLYLSRPHRSSTSLLYRVGLVAAAILVSVAASTSARAADDGSNTCPSRTVDANETPKRLAKLGVRCFKRGRFARAYSLYRRAYELEASDLLRAAMGRSLHELGIFSVARSYYEAFLDSKRGQEGATKIEKRLRQLQSDLESAAEIHLSSFPPNSRVFVELANGDWVKLGRTPVDVRLRSSEYTFRYRRPNYRFRTVVRDVHHSDNPNRVEAALYPVETSFDLQGFQLKRIGAYLSIGSVPVLTAGGIMFGFAADKFEEAEDYTFSADYVPAKQNRMLEQGHRYQRWAIGLTAAGSAVLLTGGILFFRGQAIQRQTPEASQARGSISPVVAPRFVGVVGRF